MKKTTTKQPAEKNGLAERAMIIKVTINFWAGVIKDPKASSEYAEGKRAKADRFRVDKALVAGEALTKLRAAAGEGKRALFFKSLPWGDGGFRIISADSYFDVMQSQREAAEKYNVAADEFCRAAFEKNPDTGVSLFEEGIQSLGDAANEADYPSTYAALRKRYGYNVRILPVPEATDFRVKMAKEDLDAVRTQIAADRQDILAEAMKEPFRRFHQVVSRMVERLNAYRVNEEGKAENTFRDSLVSNVKDLLDVLPSLNLARDPELDKLAAEIQGKLVVSPTVLRDDEKVRKTTATQAEKILKRLEAFI